MTNQIELLQKLEWASSRQGAPMGSMWHNSPGPRIPACPMCGGVHPEKGLREFAAEALGHRPDCDLAQALVRPAVVYADHAEYRNPELDTPVTMVCAVLRDGARIGMQSTQAWYGAGVLIPPGHPAYSAALTFITALADAQAQEGKN